LSSSLSPLLKLPIREAQKTTRRGDAVPRAGALTSDDCAL
jgi:hypothetical protein